MPELAALARLEDQILWEAADRADDVFPVVVPPHDFHALEAGIYIGKALLRHAAHAKPQEHYVAAGCWMILRAGRGSMRKLSGPKAAIIYLSWDLAEVPTGDIRTGHKPTNLLQKVTEMAEGGSQTLRRLG